MTPRSAWPIIPTLAISWVAFGQVLSLSGLAIWVVGASLVSALSVAFLAGAGRRGWAVVAMVVLTAVVPFLARTVGGDDAGPITRSSLMATGVAGATALVLRTRYPAALLAPAVILLGGACGLGAAGRAPWVVGAWAVAAAATLAMLGPYTRADLRARRRVLPFALLLGVIGLVAVAAMGAATPALTTPWTIPGAAAASGTPEDSTTNPPPTSTPSPPPSTAPTPEPSTIDPVDDRTVDATRVVVTAGLLVVLLVLLLALVAVLRRVVVGWRWRQRRRRLRQGDPRQRIVGAWTWVRLQRLRFEQPLPTAASPDVAVSVGAREHDEPLQQVARLAARVAYDPTAAPTHDDAASAWAAARVAGKAPTNSTLRQRWAWAKIGPRVVQRRLAALTPAPAAPASEDPAAPAPPPRRSAAETIGMVTRSR